MTEFWKSPYLLTAIIFLPLAGAATIIAIPTRNSWGERAIRWIAWGVSLFEFLLCIGLWFNFNSFAADDFQYMFPKDLYWIPEIGVKYKIGVDGLSLPLVVLTGLMTWISIWYSFGPIKERLKEYFAFFLLLEVGMMGTFVALDFFLFYVFWEISLVPMYFIIGIWGGPRREYAAIKFFLYTLVGSVAMLLAILALYFASDVGGGRHTFDMTYFMEPQNRNQLPLSPQTLGLCFWAFYVAFAIKVPAFPFHTWLPDAHVEAPTAGSIILAAILLKMGTYGLIRVCLPMFPDAARDWALLLMIIAVINVVYGALVAMAQTDLKKLVAYSSIGHMGFVLLGFATAAHATEVMPSGLTSRVFSEAQVAALNGAVMQMVAHGLITGALFLLVGVIYDRVHHRNIDGFGGLGVTLPQYSGVLVFMAFASLGLPGLAGFIGEFLALVGAFAVWRWLGGICVLGVVVTAAYFLWLVQRMLLGPLNEKYKDVPDMNKLEWICVAPLILLTFLIGVWPSVILGPVDQAMTKVVTIMNDGGRPLGMLP